MLKGKHIILGITGGIAAYKSVTLLRLFVKAGAEVQVVITPAGKEFITPVTLSALSGRPVISEFFTANTGTWNSHVDLGLWADAMIIAPATASTIGKMANGIADNMLVTTYLSAKCPVFVAPAMDLDMFRHPTTARNIGLLKSYGNHVIEPAEGELASHLVGKGRMEEPEKIYEFVNAFFEKGAELKGKKVLVIDGDLRHRSISAYVGSPKKGLSDYLGNRVANWNEALVIDKKHANLHVLPVGTIPPNPTELLEDEKFATLMQILRNEYDYIFVDCSPIDIVADTQIIEQYADCTLFVVRAGLLDRSLLSELESIYLEKRFKNLSVILNGTESTGGRYSYRYGYSYGYHNGYTSYYGNSK